MLPEMRAFMEKMNLFKEEKEENDTVQVTSEANEIVSATAPSVSNLSFTTEAEPEEMLVEDRTVTFLVLFACVGLLFLCTGIFIYWLWKKSILHWPLGFGRRNAALRVSSLASSEGFPGPSTSHTEYDSEGYPLASLKRDDVTFIEETGEGYFGKVYKGELRKTDGTQQEVFIKLLRHDASEEVKENFIKQVKALKILRHENILSFIGVAERDGTYNPWVVFERLAFGDLAEVLRKNNPNFVIPIPGLEPLTKDSLLNIAFQIASGMKFLASHLFPHNDLACRNCYVGPTLTIKISDFGLSKGAYACDYYREGDSRPIPLRWMSPESVMYRKFTLASDVWSFGVVLWEIYNFGKQPYYGLTNDEVLWRIEQGYLLSPPKNCPPRVKQLMLACWKRNPKERMSSKSVYNALEYILKEPWLDEELAICVTEPDVQSSSDAHLGEVSPTLGPRPRPRNLPLIRTYSLPSPPDSAAESESKMEMVYLCDYQDTSDSDSIAEDTV